MSGEHERKMVLVVDDDREFLELCESILRNSGYHTVGTSDGKKVLDLVRMCPPDLILLDMALPGSTGFEILKALQTEEYGRIPILLMSGLRKDESLFEMLRKESNVKAFLPKPLTAKEILTQVSQVLL